MDAALKSTTQTNRQVVQILHNSIQKLKQNRTQLKQLADIVKYPIYLRLRKDKGEEKVTSPYAFQWGRFHEELYPYSQMRVSYLTVVQVYTRSHQILGGFF